jgi:hypothetical protein
MPTYALRVALTFGVGAKKGVNTWHIRTGTPIAPGTHPMVTAIKNFYTSAFSEIAPSDMKADYDGTLTEVGVAAPSLVGGVTTWNATGAQPAATYGPAGVGMCVSWRSALANRQGRGRTFLNPLADNNFAADGTLVDTHLGPVRIAATALVTASLAGGDSSIGVWSTTAPRGTPALQPWEGNFYPLVSAKINDQVAWLSSRRS